MILLALANFALTILALLLATYDIAINRKRINLINGLMLIFFPLMWLAIYFIEKKRNHQMKRSLLRHPESGFFYMK